MSNSKYVNHYLSLDEIKKLKYKNICTTRTSDTVGINCKNWKSDGAAYSKNCLHCFYSRYKSGDLIQDKQKEYPIFCSNKKVIKSSAIKDIKKY